YRLPSAVCCLQPFQCPLEIANRLFVEIGPPGLLPGLAEILHGLFIGAAALVVIGQLLVKLFQSRRVQRLDRLCYLFVQLRSLTPAGAPASAPDAADPRGSG